MRTNPRSSHRWQSQLYWAYLFSWLERVFFTVRARCLVKEHNIMSAARARTLTVPSELKHTLIRRPSRLPLAILETDGETLLGERDERVSQLCMLLWQLRKSFNEIPIHGRCYIGGLSVAYPLKSLMVLHKTKMKINTYKGLKKTITCKQLSSVIVLN